MKLECLKDKLRQAVNQAERATSRNSSLPILSTVLLEAKNNKLKIKATNLEIGLEIEFNAKVEEEGVVAVNANILNNFLSNLTKEDKIKIELINNNLKIETQNSKTTLKSLNIEDFPLIPKVSSTESFKIKTKDFLAGIHSVLFAAAVSDIKPEISSVYIYQQHNQICFVATDSFRLAEKVVPVTINDWPPIIIPFKNIMEIIRVFDGVDEMIEIKTDKHQLSIFSSEIHFTTRIIDGVYPDYRQIVPKEFKTEVSISRTELINALKLANIFSDRFNQVDISFEADTKQLIIHSLNQDVGENTLSLKLEIQGDSLALSLNVKYLLDCLAIISDEQIKIQLNEKNRPLLISAQTDNSFRYLVMPINR